MTQTKILCEDWTRALASWEIPRAILHSARRSPWELRPNRFGPTLDRSDSLTVCKLKEMFLEMPVEGGKTLIDVGCGAGGISLLLSGFLNSIVGVDESETMLRAFQSNFTQSGSSGINLRLIHGRWQDVYREVESASVVLCANTLYNVLDICNFIVKLNRAALRWVVIEIHDKHPHSTANPAWKHFWGLDRPTQPDSEHILDIVSALGYLPETELFQREVNARPLDDEFVDSMTQRLCLNFSRRNEMRQFLLDNPIEPLRSRLIWWERR